MYISRHPKPLGGGTVTEDGVSIPENYAGNAFSEPPVLEEEPDAVAPSNVFDQTAPNAFDQREPVDEVVVAVGASEQTPKGSGMFSFLEKIAPKAEHLFSSDALLVFLAVLLTESENDADLGILLFLLLLF